jgi:hypothetical protein
MHESDLPFMKAKKFGVTGFILTDIRKEELALDFKSLGVRTFSK